MLALMFIIALYLDPVGAITDETFIPGVDKIEVIDVIPLDVLEKKLKRQHLRILNVEPEHME